MGEEATPSDNEPTATVEPVPVPAMGEEGTLEYRVWQYLGLRRYDLGGMAPVIQPEDQKEPDPPAEKLNGILTHELEE